MFLSCAWWICCLVHGAEMVEHLSLVDCCRRLGDQFSPQHIAVPFRCVVDYEFKP